MVSTLCYFYHGQSSHKYVMVKGGGRRVTRSVKNRYENLGGGRSGLARYMTEKYKISATIYQKFQRILNAFLHEGTPVRTDHGLSQSGHYSHVVFTSFLPNLLSHGIVDLLS